MDLPRFDVGNTEGGAVIRRGVPVTRVGGRLVTTVFDLLMAQYACAATACPASGRPATTTRGPTRPAGRRGSPRCRPRRRPGWRASSPATRNCPGPFDDLHGGRHQPLVPLRPDLPHVFHADDAVRVPGVNGGGWAHYVGQEKVRPLTGWSTAGVRAGLAAADPAHDRHIIFLPAHRPVAVRELRRGRTSQPPRPRPVRRPPSPTPGAGGAAGLDAVHPAFDRNPLDLADEAAAAGSAGRRLCGRRAEGRTAAISPARIRTTRELPAGADGVAGQPARLVGQGHGVLHAAPARRRRRCPRRRVAAGACARPKSSGASRRPAASSTCSPRSISG